MENAKKMVNEISNKKISLVILVLTRQKLMKLHLSGWVCHHSDTIGNGFEFVKKNCISLSQLWGIRDKKNVSSLKKQQRKAFNNKSWKNVIYEPFLTPLHSLRMSTNKTKLWDYTLLSLTCKELIVYDFIEKNKFRLNFLFFFSSFFLHNKIVPQ